MLTSCTACDDDPLKSAWTASGAIGRPANMAIPVNMKLASAIVAIGLASSVGGVRLLTPTASPTATSRRTAATVSSTITPTPLAGTSRAIFLSSYTFLFANGSADTCCTYGVNNNVVELWGGEQRRTRPDHRAARRRRILHRPGRHFRTEPIEQDITGLAIGMTYTVDFDYAFSQQQPFLGATFQNWGVSLADFLAVRIHADWDQSEPRLHRLVQ